MRGNVGAAYLTAPTDAPRAPVQALRPTSDTRRQHRSRIEMNELNTNPNTSRREAPKTLEEG